jgi:hypothetical protein
VRSHCCSSPAVLLIAVSVPTLFGCSVVVPLAGTKAGDGGTADGGPAAADAPPRGPDARRRTFDADMSDDTGSCPKFQVALPHNPPQAIIALDRSSTMDPRIELIRAKLIPQLMDLGRAVSIGYLEFPDRTCGSATCCVASKVLVEPALGSAIAIDKQLVCNPAGGPCLKPGMAITPTDDALRMVETFWTRPTSPADRFVVIVTDGPPNCGGDPDPPCLRTRSEASDLDSKDIETAILGIGGRTTIRDCLSRVALNGGNVFPHGTAAGLPYVWINDVTDPKVLNDAITEVLSPIRERTCVVKLAGPRDQIADVTVLVKKVVLGYDSSGRKGWSFVPPRSRFSRSTEIRIAGKECDQLLSGELKARDVEAQVTCDDCGSGIDCR